MKEQLNIKGDLVESIGEKINNEFIYEDIEHHNDKFDNNVEPISTQEKIDILFENFKDFLKEKNRRYGDSALHPMQVFSKIETDDQLCNRLDDKLNRIKNSKELKKNDVSDIFGYIGLLMIQKNWLEFNDLLD